MENLTKEQRKFVREILKIPSMEVINVALNVVNLSVFERKVIKLTELDNLTEMEAKDILSDEKGYEIDIRTLQRAKKEAFWKLYEVWSKNYLISKIARVV